MPGGTFTGFVDLGRSTDKNRCWYRSKRLRNQNNCQLNGDLAQETGMTVVSNSGNADPERVLQECVQLPLKPVQEP